MGYRSHVGYSDDLISETDERTLAEHLKEAHNFNSVDCFNSNYILDVSPRDLDHSEQKWVNRLVTLKPFGLNKEKPGDVSSSVSSMCTCVEDCWV